MIKEDKKLEHYLRKDEYFVIEALCNFYDGTWLIGEGPSTKRLMDKSKYSRKKKHKEQYDDVDY